MVTASYEIALFVAKNKKPHTIEKLIMPAAKVLVKKHVIGDEAALKLNSVSLLNNAIQRRITEMSTDINELSPSGGTELKIWICKTTGRNNGRVELRTASSICALCE